MKAAWGVGSIIGLVCGAELLIAAALGGAGIGALFGLKGIIIGSIVVAIAILVVVRLRRGDKNTGSPAEAPSPEHSAV